MTTLERYVQAKKELDAFYESNIALLGEYEMMLQEVAEFEEALKREAKESKIDIDAGDSKFQYVQRYKKWIDYNKAIDCMETLEQKEMLMDITAIKKEVDMDEFIRLCREGILPDRARIEAYQEEEMAPQVRLVKNKE